MEKWKSVAGYEGIYEVSDIGRLKSLSRKIKCRNGMITTVNEKIMKQRVDHEGYFTICLYKNKKGFHTKVSRIVAIAFIDNPESKPQVNHIDGNKSNNVADNLEWTTASENMKHAYRTGLKDTHGERHPSNKLTEIDVVKIKRLSSTTTGASLARIYNVSDATISNIVRGKSWRCVDERS